MRFALKIGVSIVLLVAIALGLVDTLNYFKYKTLLAGLVLSRMEVATGDLQNGVQEALSLGLSLDDTRAAANLIAQAKKNDPLIVSIAVYQAGKDGGKIVYDTDPNSAGQAVPTGWIGPLFGSDDPDRLWHVDDDRGTVVGATLVDRLVQPIGGIALRYSGTYEQLHLEAMRTQLITSALEVLALAVVIDLGGILLVFRPISARLKAMNVELQAAAGAGASTDPAINAFGARLREASDMMSRAEAALDNIERNEPDQDKPR